MNQASNSLRVCFVAHLSLLGGAESFLLDQADYLAAKGITVYAIIPKRGPLAAALAQRGIEFRTVHHPWWWKKGLEGAAEPDYQATAQASGRMARQLGQWSVDLVYTHTVVSPAGAMAAAMAGLPHVWHLHEFSYAPECIDMAVAKPALARLMDLTSNLIVFNSRAVSREWNGSFVPSKTMIVRNWIRPTPSGRIDIPPENLLRGQAKLRNRFVALQLGSVLPMKRQMDSIQAVAKLASTGCDIALLIAGSVLDEGYRREMLAFIREHQLEDRVYLLGHVENPSWLMQVAKVALVPSCVESFGRVTVEAMGQGVPVIGAAAGGTAEIIEDGVNGLLFPPGDVEVLAGKLHRLIQDEPLREGLIARARKTAEQFSSPDVEMAPLLARMRGLVGKRNPAWPLGQLLAAGSSRPLPIVADGERLLKKMRRRLHLSLRGWF